MAFGKVYCFGPTFRAEKSKTRRHLMEFWMIEPEMAFYDQEDNMKLQEEYVSYLVQHVLEHCQRSWQCWSGISLSWKRWFPLPRLSYDQAVEMLQKNGSDIQWGEDLGRPMKPSSPTTSTSLCSSTAFPRRSRPLLQARSPAAGNRLRQRPSGSRGLRRDHRRRRAHSRSGSHCAADQGAQPA